MVSRSGALKWFPEIVDQWVVWIEAEDFAGPYTVKARDLAAAKTYKIATSSRPQQSRRRPPHGRRQDGVHGGVHVV